jgi:aryl-alcohol dehydrogenase-like predicted oxidoreductase
VERALDLGVNCLDTAEVYHTEAIIGTAIRTRSREELVLSTKKTITRADGSLISAPEVIAGCEASLRRLGTDYVDIYHLHGVRDAMYDDARDALVPVLRHLQQDGKIRFLGITEAFAADPPHRMLSRAVHDDCWDVMMVGFNLLNQSARARVFVYTLPKQIGVLAMFVVRQALSRPAHLRHTIAELVEQGQVDQGVLDLNDPWGFLLHDGGAESVPDVAYRFCRDEPGVHVVLSGTGNIQHLEDNLASILRPSLSEKDRQRLMQLFAQVDTVSGQ